MMVNIFLTFKKKVVIEELIPEVIAEFIYG